VAAIQPSVQASKAHNRS
jgi:hypothetical protein